METIMSLKEKWTALNNQEQRALLAGSIAIVFFIAYQFIYEPFSAKSANIINQLRYHKSLNSWLKSVEPKLKAAKTQPNKTPLATSKLLSTTANSLKLSALKSFNYELQQADSNAVQLSFKKVPYIELSKWMMAFWRKYPLELKELTIQRSNSTGEVSANLKFKVNSP